MAFTVNDVEDLLRVLRDNPEWREAVRREVLGAQLLALPNLVRQNSVDIRANASAINELTAAVTRVNTKVDDGFARADQRFDAVDQHLYAVDRRFKRLDGRLGTAEGNDAEQKWASGFSGCFGKSLRQVRLVTPRELERFESADEAGAISGEAAEAVRGLDLIVQGVRGRGADSREVLLAVEVSTRMEDYDVSRAIDTAAILRQVGYNADPVVAGSIISDSLRASAELAGVTVLLRPEDISHPPSDEP